MNRLLIYMVLVPTGWILARLPMFMLFPLGRALGRLWCRLKPDRRHVAARNLELCFHDLDENARETLLRQVIDATGVGLMETVLAIWASDRRLRRLFDVEGDVQLQQQLKQDKPLLLYSAHFTSVELACRLVNLVSPRPIAMVVRRNANPALEAVIDRARRRHAGDTIEKKQIRQLLQLLQSGTPVMYGFDQHFSSQTVDSTLFGVPAVTLSVAGKLASRSQAAVMSFWCVRNNQGRYQLCIDDVWQDYPSGDDAQDADRYNRWLEQKISASPAQYLWVHRRFRQTEIDGIPAYGNTLRREKHRD